jgi:hypothetical protein
MNEKGPYPPGTTDYETRLAGGNARSDSALSHPNPVVIEIRCQRPPRPPRRGAPPNAAPNSANVPVIATAVPAEYAAQRYSLLRAAYVAQVRAATGIPAKIGMAQRLCRLPSPVDAIRRQSYPERLAPIAVKLPMNRGPATTPHKSSVGTSASLSCTDMADTLSSRCQHKRPVVPAGLPREPQDERASSPSDGRLRAG